MKVLVLAASFSLLAGSAAHAQHMNADDGPCRDKVVTTDLASCLDAAYKSADKSLNRLYGSLGKVLQPNEQRALLVSERLWLQYRDAECAAQRELYADGTASGPVYLACLEALTRQRVAELNVGYGWRLDK